MGIPGSMNVDPGIFFGTRNKEKNHEAPKNAPNEKAMGCSGMAGLLCGMAAGMGREYRRWASTVFGGDLRPC